MIRRFTLRVCEGMLFVLFTLAFAGSMIAQTPIYSEDFSGGLPAGWVSADENGTAAEWTWCDQPVTAVGAGCVEAWETYNNQHGGTFNSTSGSNGFLVMDSDKLGNAMHAVSITSDVLNFSAESEVFLKFESLIGVWDFPTLGNALVRVSTDNTNWTDFDFVNIRRGQEGNDPEFFRWTINPEYTVLDISSVAAGQSTVYIQWFWRGFFEYYWLLDDIEIYNEDVRNVFLEDYDLRVQPFHALAPNYATPSSQVVPFGFLSDVYNGGYETATNVNLQATVTQGGTTLFDETLAYGTLAPDSLAENEPFLGNYTPDGTMGTYEVNYTVTGDNTDESPDNNATVNSFVITDTLFSKTNNPNTFILPTQNANGPWAAPTAAPSWGAANYYRIVNGTGYYARYTSFALNNYEELVGKALLLNLYAWDDQDEDGLATAGERTAVGTNFYVIEGTETPGSVITLPLLAGGVLGPIALEDNTNYIMAVEYTGVDNEEFSMEIIGEDIDYSARIISDNENFGAAGIYYGFMTSFGSDFSSQEYNDNWFGADMAPMIQLSIGTNPLSSVADLFSENELKLSPNPAMDFIQLDINLDTPAKDLSVMILNTNGSIVQSMKLKNVKEIGQTISLQGMASGTYFMHLTDGDKIATKKFLVVK